MHPVLDYLQRRQEDLIHDLESFVAMESSSYDKAALDGLGAVLTERFAALGARCETVEQPERGDHLRIEWGEGEGQVLLLCHRDTVFKTGDIARNPLRREHGRLYGPGVFDMKAGFTQVLWALQTMQELSLRPRRRVVLLITADEEIGSGTSRSLIEAEARRSDAALVLEPALGEAGALKTWRKGVGEYRLRITGVAAHAGADPTRGASAIGELAEQVLRLHALTDLEAGTTVNVGLVQGGTRPNVTAEHAEAVIDVRVMTVAEGERLDRLLKSLHPVNPRCSLQMTGGIERLPLVKNDKTAALFRRAAALYRELGLGDLSESGTGGGSDGNFASGVGCPTLDGLGPVGDGAHTFEEYVVIDRLPERTALLVRLLETI